MCTVSFFKTEGAVVLTSNRDEKVARGGALPPEAALYNGKNIIFPRDAKAGGSWFAANEDGAIAILLNGAFESHVKKESYRRSRGLVLLDVISANAPYAAFVGMNLEDIEPFTIILYLEHKLYQLVWDAKEKTIKQLNTENAHIWSSVTLYGKEVIAEREQWFKAFLKENPGPSAQDLRNFHNYQSREDDQNGLIINRNDIYKTLSITQAEVIDNDITIYHKDLLGNKFHVSAISNKNTPVIVNEQV